jgi:hypothetical protein
MLNVYLTENYWETTYNGVFYTGATITVGSTPNTTRTPSAGLNAFCAAGDEYIYP